MTGKLKIQLSQFKIVQTRFGKALRCTLSWLFEDEATGAVMGTSLVGCLIGRDSVGRLKFSTPVSNQGTYTGRNTTLTADLNRTILDMIEKTPYSKQIGSDLPVNLRAKYPKDVDASLPNELEVVEAVEETSENPDE